jgi:two-component system cell cycle response regulator CpdR
VPPPQPAAIASDLEHDLVNALASIVGFSQVIRRDPALPDDLRHSADLLGQEASRARAMVGELLDLIRQKPAHPSASTAQGPVVSWLDPERTTAQASATRPRVLVLDDDSSMRAFLDKALTLLGYEPVVTSVAADAVERATVGDLAVLLFDHQMAGMSGTEAFEAVVASRPDLAARVVMMSGDTLRPGLNAFAARYPVDVLAKPFDLDTLDRTIRAVMEATGQSRG